MAKFFNSSAASYFLEEIIKSAKDRLVLINPYLRVNERSHRQHSPRLSPFS